MFLFTAQKIVQSFCFLSFSCTKYEYYKLNLNMLFSHGSILFVVFALKAYNALQSCINSYYKLNHCIKQKDNKNKVLQND